MGTRPVQMNRGPRLEGLMLVTILKSLVIFEEGALHFHFSLGLANYLPGPDFNIWLTMKSSNFD